MVALPVFIAFRGVCVDQQKIKNKQQIKNVVERCRTVQRLIRIFYCFDFIILL